MLMEALGVVFQAVECNFSHPQMAVRGKHPEKNSLMAVCMQQRLIGKLMCYAERIFIHSFIQYGVMYKTIHQTLSVSAYSTSGLEILTYTSIASDQTSYPLGAYTELLDSQLSTHSYRHMSVGIISVLINSLSASLYTSLDCHFFKARNLLTSPFYLFQNLAQIYLYMKNHPS